MQQTRIRTTRSISSILGSCTLLAWLLVGTGCGAEAQSQNGEAGDKAAPHVVADSPIEAGRYLAIVAGCNDCHTAGYLQTEGNVPEEEWLTGSPVGWRGPWGTTYASNLRRFVQTVSADDWVEILHTRDALPPMPWMNVHHMSDRDAEALYRYIESLEVKGAAMPENVPPGQEPETPYVSLMPQNMEAAPAQAPQGTMTE